MSRRFYQPKILFATYCALFLLFLAGCATQLAPSYDKAVVEGLNAVNTETMTLFASASFGTKAEDFASRAEKYNVLIGKLDSLAILAGARPIPKNKVSDAINKALDKRGASPIVDDDATPPSAHAIKAISTTVAKMRDTDKKQGVTATEVQAFKGQAAIFFDQAITYENFLQR
jgi:PBP1b-binding outer membrane lipoprotein LpoB